MKEDENVVNVSTEQEQKERQKIGEEKTALINEIKQVANAIDSEVIGTHLYEVGYRKIIYRDMTEALNHEIKQLKEENDKLKQALEDDYTFSTTDGSKYNILDSVRKVSVKEFSRKVLNIVDELYDEESKQYLKAKINDLLKELQNKE